MGIVKLGKKLIKVGRKTGKTLGKRGKELAEAVFERAITILETELKGAEHGQQSAATQDRKRDHSADGAPAEGKPSRKPAAQEANHPHAPAPARSHAAGARPRQPGSKPPPKPVKKSAKKSAKREGPAAAESRAAEVERRAPAAPASDGGNPPKR
jgi:hypothetical protein